MIVQKHKLQNKFVNNFLKGYFGPYHKISQQIVQIIQSFLFASHYRKKNIYILKQGQLILKIRKNQSNKQSKNQTNKSFILTDYEYEHIKNSSKISLKQNDRLMIANKYYQNEKLIITKIWQKPQTKTQQKILSYCGKFKQFLLGKHHQTKTIDIRYLKRQFLIPFYQKDQFNVDFKNIEQNDATFCSYDVLDSYMTLITQNYIQIEIQSNQYSDRSDKIYKIVPQETDVDILKGVKIIFNKQLKKWFIEGQNIAVWKQVNILGRSKSLIRTIDGQVDLVDGKQIKSVYDFQYLFNNQSKYQINI